ncbi:acetyl-CoA carboxyl transferase [Actinosynnema sp. ALI-1.44]|uniref:acetyl-CoA carboxylase carboxyltransferase subunit alpha/beta n=1 Tax=Actinosynnema sp. ALI-1.44 TaxID=1933779 RepID=UPI00097C1404|nr:acetyl-CoA carboxylase carboxyltransferase subunit alpha/beta [Actinosynnema sp. ALI-1.44]ONI77886.1 acetyl-CoA carboxyl transferase [Actinosynnema sp. ALI-1.44]
MTSTVDRADPVGGGADDWLACRKCQSLLYRKRFDRLGRVCPDCGWHGPLTARQWLDRLLDAGSARAVLPGPSVHDPLEFTDLVPYAVRLQRARSATGMADAVAVAQGTARGRRLVVAAMDFRFLGGSLGTAAGEAIATAAETALAERVPLLVVTASGGARMQEGVLSLMQLPKTINAMSALDEAGLLTVTLVADPTFGGVAASYATHSDVILAEPGARMGFAGARVIEQTIRQRLPDGFQTAEFLLDHGLVDGVCPRAELPHTLAALLAIGDRPATGWGRDRADPVWRDPDQVPQQSIDRLVRLSRHFDRPSTLDLLTAWTDGFVELHGDRLGEDCPAIVGGLARLDGLPVMVIGHQKGNSTAELVRRGFGMSSPAGYRKAIRLMRMAAKLGIPVITLVDTPGAYPGRTAEEHGQAHAIAQCLRTLGGLPVPVVSLITGEGGSGGALALAVADRVLICEHAIYSVISPEGCAAILWRDPGAAAAAAAALRVDARSLLRLGVVDGVVPEPGGGAHRDPTATTSLARDAVVCALRELLGRPGTELVAARRARFRRFGTTER